MSTVYCKTEEIIVDTGDYNSDEADDSIRLTIEDSGGEQHYQPSSRYSEKSSHHQRNRSIQQFSESDVISPGAKNISKSTMENEKRMRREIANSNERRRMQSINAGFQSLRSLLPHHEGEKLSKAAILQQTSQYIIELEREKTHLLSQNSQLKRTLGQHELASSGGDADIACSGGGGGGGQGGALKKRKLTDNVITLQTISDSSDEGLGSMSPEPVTLLTNASKNSAVAATAYISTTSKELAEMKAALEAERKRRILAEERLRHLTCQIYPTATTPSGQYTVHRGEVIEHTDNIREEHEMEMSIIDDPMKLQVVEIDALPAVGQTQVVVCSPLGEMVDIQDEEEVVETITEEMMQEEEMRDDIIIKEEIAEYVEVPSRLQPILEAAIKAEPKVEVERINATLTKLKDDAKDASQQGNSGRMYLTSTSRQNLETIVEAIRHLEGDHLFAENTGTIEQQKKQIPKAQVVTVQQEAPLALTNKPLQRKQLPVDLSPFLQLKKSPAVTIETVPRNVAAPLKISSSKSSSSSISSVGTNNSSIANGVSSNTTYLMSGSGTLKVQTAASPAAIATVSGVTTVSVTGAPVLVQSQSTPSAASSSQTATSVTIAAALKQCRPGVIVAKQISS